MTHCPRCDLRLDAAGRCPADIPQLPEYDRREYGTVQQLVHRLGSDVTPGMVRQWRKRKGLADWDGFSFLDEATAIEARVRLGGKGRKRGSRRARPRRVDVGLPAAA